MIQQYDFSGTGRQIDAQGSFFRYESGTDGSGVVDIRLVIDGNSVGTFVPGDSVELPRPAKRWEIVPVSTGCIGRIKIGNARVTSQKLSGIVQTVDSSRARSLAGSAFAGFGYCNPSTGNYSKIQLWNPANSGKKLFVNKAFVCSTTAQFTLFSITDVRCDTYYSTGKSKSVVGGTSNVAELRVVGTGRTSDVNTMVGLYLTASNTLTFEPSEPLVVVPGAGLLICSGSLQTDLAASFEWFEEAA